MDLEYFLAPVVLILVATFVVWCGLRHLATISTRFTRSWPQLVDRTMIAVAAGVAVAFAATATFNAVALARFPRTASIAGRNLHRQWARHAPQLHRQRIADAGARLGPRQ